MLKADRKDELYKLYWEDGLTQREIGKIYSKSNAWVCKQMRKCNVSTRNNVDIKTRFLFHINVPDNLNDCWEWIGYKNERGYGTFNFNGELMFAHRMSYILFIGEFDSTLCVLHKCDNPSCVNPDHLFLGTNDDNMKDRDQKDRKAKGEKQGNSKLTEENIKEIKTLLLQEVSCAKIGRIFKVSRRNISEIKHGKLWNHVQ